MDNKALLVKAWRQLIFTILLLCLAIWFLSTHGGTLIVLMAVGISFSAGALGIRAARRRLKDKKL